MKNLLSKYQTFEYVETSKRIRNLRFADETNIDEFLSIQEQLNHKKVRYVFDKNFDIKIV